MPYIDEQFIEDMKRRLGDAGKPRASAEGASGEIASSALDDEAFEAYKKIQRLVSASERSSKGLRERLARDGFSPEAVEAALARSIEYGIVDDVRYAEAYVRAKLGAGKGRRGIEAELRDLGIDPDEVLNWAECDEDEVQRALAVLEKRPPTAKNKRDAAYRRLVSKGYGSAAAQSAARIWSESS
ncbi:regulatory protein RecX [Raoultibacter phocaeensis]|uniref:regulatory protein RecX n=1 Tax=Raoultibacter phocaeensis TaxID=2479841 RepID=UPI001118C921|nr:regulatory protein RecX [Raoultibacter phocaeensis]